MPISTQLAIRLAQALTDQGAANELITALGVSATDSIVARAGGGQASATQLASAFNRVITVATSGDSVKLPASTAGTKIGVINATSNPMQVYGLGTDKINGVASATGVTQMPNSFTEYACVTVGAWTTDTLGKSIKDNGNSASGTVSLDLSISEFQLVTLTGTPTLALANVGTTRAFTVILAQDGTGSRTVTWFAGILWAGGTAPTLTTGVNKRDVFCFVNLGGGVYLGSAAGQNY